MRYAVLSFALLSACAKDPYREWSPDASRAAQRGNEGSGDGWDDDESQESPPEETGSSSGETKTPRGNSSAEAPASDQPDASENPPSSSSSEQPPKEPSEQNPPHENSPSDAPAPASGSVPASPFASGSRIKGRWIVGDDGSRQWIGWRDTQRNEDCGYERDSSGKYRCFPANKILASDTYFADAEKTVVLVPAAGACSSGTTYAYRSSACGGVQTIYSLGSEYTGATIFVSSGGGPAYEIPRGMSFFQIGDQISVGAFAGAQESVE